jgi:hypothetical protein
MASSAVCQISSALQPKDSPIRYRILPFLPYSSCTVLVPVPYFSFMSCKGCGSEQYLDPDQSNFDFFIFNLQFT